MTSEIPKNAKRGHKQDMIVMMYYMTKHITKYNNAHDDN